jgi:hypothetical protein
MFDLYIGNKNYSSWSLRPWLLMKHFGIPFNEHMVSGCRARLQRRAQAAGRQRPCALSA